MAWLVFQAASLSALVPRDCCSAHRHDASTVKPGCHQQADAKLDCPMEAAEGIRCPMHHEAAGAVQPATPDRCSMRGTCEGPVAAFMALLANHGVLRDPFVLTRNLHPLPATLDHREKLISQLASPDSPPPRA
jgi:hypothetical protein